MGEWQPIKTAPKDGESVLLATFDVDDYLPVVAFWDTSEGCDGGWFLYPTEGMHEVLYPPTHWMPLPPPPGDGQ
jgi:hypothetical protein